MRRTAFTLLPLLALAACDDNPVDPAADADRAPLTASANGPKAGGNGPLLAVDPAVEAALRALPGTFESTLGDLPANVAPLGAYYYGEQMGGVVFFEDRGNKQLDVQYVPGDPRRNGRTDIGWTSVMTPPPIGGLSQADVDGAVARAMATWGSQSCSSGLDVPQRSFFGWPFVEADIVHAGFVNLGPGVLGATLPFFFVDDDGNPTDIDGDGARDYAFAIIYYAIGAPWGIDPEGTPPFDLETIVLHEAGHGMGQGHFGKAFGTLANLKVHFAPYAVMNAGYSQVQHTLTGTDRAGHCGMFGSWPNN